MDLRFMGCLDMKDQGGLSQPERLKSDFFGPPKNILAEMVKCEKTLHDNASC